MSEKLIIRSYSKAIFLVPTLIMSIIGWIIQAILHKPIILFEAVWLVVFLANLFVVYFDFSSGKFIILMLVALVLLLLGYLILFPYLFNPDFFSGDFKLMLGFTSHFYIIMTGIIGLFLLVSVSISLFDFYMIEKNELYHRKGLFNMTERWSLTNLRFKKEIPDIFEFIAFRAGTITFYPTKTDAIILPTVLNVNKKEAHLNNLLSSIKVSTDK